MPRFIHTSDLHLNALRVFKEIYLDRFKKTMADLNQVVEEEDVDFIVVAGDIYDRKDVLHEERKALSWWLSSCSVPVICISGNHDKRINDIIGDTTLNYLSSLKMGNVKVYDGAPTVLKALNCNFVLIPYEKWTDHELYLVLQSLVVDVDKSLPTIVVMHEAVKGCVNDVGYNVVRDHQIRIDPGLLKEFSWVTYWAMGDMHKVQRIAPNVWYSGAPHQIKFDDVREKGVLLVNTDDPTNPEFIELESMPLVKMDELPESWGDIDENQLVQLTATVAVRELLPKNVQCLSISYKRTASSEVDDQVNLTDEIGILDGLSKVLLRTKLPDTLYQRALDLAVEKVEQKGILVKRERL